MHTNTATGRFLERHYPTFLGAWRRLKRRARRQRRCVGCGEKMDNGSSSVVCRRCRLDSKIAGFVLPIVIGVMLLLSVLIVSALSLATTSTQTAAADRWHQKVQWAAEGALALGEAGFAEFRSNGAPVSGDSIPLVFHRFDEKIVSEAFVRRVDNDSIFQPGDPEEYVITARAWTEPFYAEEILAINVTVRGDPPWSVGAGFTALGGLRKNGSSGVISGVDRCGPEQPGIIAPDSSVLNPNEPIDSAGWIEGFPPIKYAHQDSLVAWLDFEEGWKDLRDGPFDYEIGSGDTWPPPEAFVGDWPVIRIAPGYDLRSGESGRGIIIAPSNLNAGGGWEWEGIILVGNELRLNGDATVDGALFTGLNALIGEPIGRSDLGNGTKNLNFDSCAIREALKHRDATIIFHAWRVIW